MQFERNGTIVRQSQPVRRLKTVKKVLTIDSRDRDPTKYAKVNGGASSSDPGDYVVYLPRVYENVVSLRLRSAIVAAPSAAGWTDNYVLMSLEGLNKIDETSTGANRSGFVDHAFAKLSNPNMTTNATNVTYTIFYNDKVDEENIAHYTPPIGRLDRFHITFFHHPGTVTVSPTSSLQTPITFGTAEHTLTFEIEYLDNVFEDVSSFETRLDATVFTNGRGY